MGHYAPSRPPPSSALTGPLRAVLSNSTKLVENIAIASGCVRRHARCGIMNLVTQPAD